MLLRLSHSEMAIAKAFRAIPFPVGIAQLTERVYTLGGAEQGYNDDASKEDLEKWGCHWFTSKGPLTTP